MSDNFIRCQCETPTHIYTHPNGVKEYSSEPLPFHHVRARGYPSGNELPYTNIPICTSVSNRDLELWKPMITPFVNKNVREVNGKRIISYGLSSGGYDVRLATSFKIFTNINSVVIDLLDMTDKCYVDHEGEFVIIPPNGYVLGHTLEYFNIPEDVLVVVLAKSTYARVGVGINCTPVEPGFRGAIVIEVANLSSLPVKIYANQGIAQFLFYKMEENCKVSYADKAGKYQGQTGLTLAKL
jgi:dCTP deaminase